jgi:hypothetical protein
MLDEEPSKLHDALSSVLGLEDLVTVEKLLGEARRTREAAYKQEREALKSLLPALEQLDDDRARRCVQALAGKGWDIDALESVLAGTLDGEAAGELEVLRRLASVEAPSVERVMEAAERLRGVAAAMAKVAGTDAERAWALADIPERALDFHAGPWGRRLPGVRSPAGAGSVVAPEGGGGDGPASGGGRGRRGRQARPGGGPASRAGAADRPAGRARSG